MLNFGYFHCFYWKLGRNNLWIQIMYLDYLKFHLKVPNQNYYHYYLNFHPEESLDNLDNQTYISLSYFLFLNIYFSGYSL